MRLTPERAGGERLVAEESPAEPRSTPVAVPAAVPVLVGDEVELEPPENWIDLRDTAEPAGEPAREQVGRPARQQPVGTGWPHPGGDP